MRHEKQALARQPSPRFSPMKDATNSSTAIWDRINDLLQNPYLIRDILFAQHGDLRPGRGSLT